MMSGSPERISSYRRHFEESSSSTYQMRVSSPSPTRRSIRNASVGFSSHSTGGAAVSMGTLGRRTGSLARRSRTAGSGVSAGALVCVGLGGELPIDLDVAAAENQEFLSTRKSEKQEMIILNDRLAIYIDKVRSLEQQNKLLETEIGAYQNRFQKPSGLRLLYEEQLRQLKKTAEQMRVQRDIALASKESTAAQLEAIKFKYEEAIEQRKKAEMDIEAFRPDVDKATSARIALEKQLEYLEVEIEFLKRVHQQEIEELMQQIYSAHLTTESLFALPDLASALKQIQTQYDDIAAKNLQEMDAWYKTKFQDLTSRTTLHVDRVRGIRNEIAAAKKDIQSKDRDLYSLRTKNEALETQIREMQEKYKKELEDLQAQIEALQFELKSTKEKIALHLRKYQDLLNVKMALEIEITTYRKLIEGEDLRLSSMVQTLSLTGCTTSTISAGVSTDMGGAGDTGNRAGLGVANTGSIDAGGVGGTRSGASMSGGMYDTVGAARYGGMGSTAGITGGIIGSMSAGRVVGMATGGAGHMGSATGVGGADFGDMGSVEGVKRSVSGGMGEDVDSEGVWGTERHVGLGGGAVVAGTGQGGATDGGPEPDGAGRIGEAGAVRVSSSARGDGEIGSSARGDGGISYSARGDGGIGSIFRGKGGVGVVGTGGVGEAGGHGTSETGAGSLANGGGGVRGGKEGSYHVEGKASWSGDAVGSAISGIVGVVGAEAGRGSSGSGGVAGGAGAGLEYGDHKYDGRIENYAAQAVELTERRTVLIRTVKNENNIMEMDHHEQTYTIFGAADNSDDD